MSKRQQDTIEFALSAEQTVVNNTVRIISSIAGIVNSELTEQNLKDTIRTLMKKFINAEWQFSNMNRTPHQSGLEQLTVTAICRVSESENYALDRRRMEASRDVEGMQIVSVQTDTSPSATQIEETQRKLRVTLVKKAIAEALVLNEAIGETYRVGKVTFHDLQDVNARGGTMMAMAASNAPKTMYGSGFDGGSDEIGNAVKLTMQATVELRISR